MNKIAVIGKGTAGCIALVSLLSRTMWDIDWYFDNNIKPQAVGEGTILNFPSSLALSLGLNHNDYRHLFDSTHKESIFKENWGNKVNKFHHHFVPPYISLHFNAVKFQEYIFNLFQNNPRVKYIEKNVSHDEIDADYIVDCSGYSNIDKSDLVYSDYIPINSVHVNQCKWDYPRFQHTLAIARPYGWVFGIPLQNRCSIGYLYNNNINTLEEVSKDVKSILDEYNLAPSGITNNFSFKNYYRKNNFTDRVVYNGNASFFLEPMEATSIGFIYTIMDAAYNMWANFHTIEDANKLYYKTIKELEAEIMLHYFAGSTFKTKFWIEAEQKGRLSMEEAVKNPDFIYMIKNSNEDLVRLLQIDYSSNNKFYGTWGLASFKVNIDNLGIRSKLEQLIT